MLEYDRTWTFTSTGVGAWEDARHATAHAYYLQAPLGSTATIQIETRIEGSTFVAIVGSPTNLNASSVALVQLSGIYDQIRPHVTDLTASTGTCSVKGIGQSGT